MKQTIPRANVRFNDSVEHHYYANLKDTSEMRGSRESSAHFAFEESKYFGSREFGGFRTTGAVPQMSASIKSDQI